MKILVFGASGPTGREVVTQAIDAGYEVRAFARRPAAVGAWSPRLELVQGDVLEWGHVGPAMRGVDAVISALGTGRDFGETNLFSDGFAAILWAMAEAHVRRFVCVTSAGTIEDPNEPFWYRTGGRWMARHVYADQRRAEERLRASDSDWTIVRPPRLLDGPKRGDYKIVKDGPAGKSYEVSRADLAEFMVAEMMAMKYVRAAVGIGY
ncbi:MULTISPECIES: NAD(P)-dependent oxidoreductase [Polyangium]|uniref:SDR family oxidoreductase n=2 Tax=Polyangium TaxID=55 RepID=A0A4U1JF23_9BACT|nr:MULTISPECIES: SDR family oxidoreductase [Polyangium]MDI1429306.1 SDR family oxidoreductase [Polyangium sorediatum]TKD08871.1 SDR family oxidoreductase [Polyangium fumosum]